MNNTQMHYGRSPSAVHIGLSHREVLALFSAKARGKRPGVQMALATAHSWLPKAKGVTCSAADVLGHQLVGGHGQPIQCGKCDCYVSADGVLAYVGLSAAEVVLGFSGSPVRLLPRTLGLPVCSSCVAKYGGASERLANSVLGVALKRKAAFCGMRPAVPVRITKGEPQGVCKGNVVPLHA
ncbi:hypothetical protein [Salipiger mangrovisoli]|uniref:Uncharacterized protein n=1 Tax=Salipiger mangrovisoli TaxID=2865933 RepID=A0ABR9X452_9RHOB|nr:hypothetical protein [Salipiger mangrovisoli]MBE9638285.1 hypothetical protein [Salipiger mangrovisoli]